MASADKNKKYIKAGIWITVILCTEKCLGFCRDMLQAYYFGTGVFVDTVVSASLVASVFFGWLSSISVSFTPIYKNACSNGHGERTANRLMVICAILSVAACGICFVFARLLIYISMPGFDIETQTKASGFLKIISISLLFANVSRMKKAWLSCEGYYIKAVLPELAINVIQILVYFLFARYSENAIVYGIILAYLVEWGISSLLSGCSGYKFHIVLPDKDCIKQVFSFMLPITVTYIIDDVYVFFNKLFASYLQQGSIASLSYANSLKKAVYTLITLILSTILYPKLSELIANKRLDLAKNITKRCMKILSICLCPFIMGCIITSESIVKIIFERGAFDSISTGSTRSAFCAYIIGVLPLSIEAVLTKFFYSNGMAKKCTALGICSVVLNILFNALLVGPFQHVGLAFSTSLAALCMLPLYLYVYKGGTWKKLFIFLKNERELYKILISILLNIILGIIVYIIFPIGKIQGFLSNLIYIFAIMIFSFVSMFTSLLIMKETDFLFLLSIVKKYFKNKIKNGKQSSRVFK